MGFKISEFKTDPKKEEEGIWISIGGNASLKIARLSNKKCQKYLNLLRKPHQRQIRLDNLDDDVAREMLRKAVSKFVLLDWKNLEEDDDTPIKYSHDKAYELLGIRDFFDEVFAFCQQMELFKLNHKEDSVGNSSGASNGTSSGEHTSKSSKKPGTVAKVK